jgi:hypothetical protein
VVAAKAGLATEDQIDNSVSMLTEWGNHGEQTREAMSTRARDLFLNHFEIGVASRRIAEELRTVVQDLPS